MIQEAARHADSLLNALYLAGKRSLYAVSTPRDSALAQRVRATAHAAAQVECSGRWCVTCSRTATELMESALSLITCGTLSTARSAQRVENTANVAYKARGQLLNYEGRVGLR
eukprot:4136743-Pleurochrysis_carterae.AAC.1